MTISIIFSENLMLFIFQQCFPSILSQNMAGSSWSWSYGSWIYNLTMKSVVITTSGVSLNPAHGEVYSIHYVIKFVSDLRQAGAFLRVLGTLVSSTNKNERHDITEILLKLALSTLTLIQNKAIWSYKSFKTSHLYRKIYIYSWTLICTLSH